MNLFTRWSLPAVLLVAGCASTPQPPGVTFHASGNVLVVGHSNTVPDIVAALCACEVAAIDEGTYGDRYDVRIALDGSTTLVRGTY
jgi:hypothetical protein